MEARRLSLVMRHRHFTSSSLGPYPLMTYSSIGISPMNSQEVLVIPEPFETPREKAQKVEKSVLSPLIRQNASEEEIKTNKALDVDVSKQLLGQRNPKESVEKVDGSVKLLNKDGKGYSLQLETCPINGRIVLRVDLPREESAA